MQAESIDDTPRLQALSRDVFWQRHIALWRSSGLSKMAYCQQHALTYHQMVYWSTKQKQPVEAEAGSGDFVALRVCPDATDSVLRVRLPNGLTIEGIDEHSVELVGKLIAQL